jgi:hypothetical protein
MSATSLGPSLSLTRCLVALALEKPTLSSLQNVRCSDVFGNFISELDKSDCWFLILIKICTGDPDRSNPTRWRMERPLETIKSFEITIDRAHAQRQSSYIRMISSMTKLYKEDRKAKEVVPTGEIRLMVVSATVLESLQPQCLWQLLGIDNISNHFHKAYNCQSVLYQSWFGC